MLMWLLAFMDLPAGVPEWVRRTQAVCFGTDESGLPSPAGWIVLIAGPLSFLAAIFVGLAPDFLGVLRSSRSWRGLFLLVGTLALVESGWIAVSVADKFSSAAGPVNEGDRMPFPAEYPQGVSMAPDFDLTDQTGAVRSMRSLRGRTVLVSFVFSHCASVCPALTALLLKTQRESSDIETAVVLITLDPWRDPPSSLPALAARWELPNGAYLLSGAPEQVEHVLDLFAVARQRDAQNGDVIHPPLVYVINPAGRMAFALNNPSTEWLSGAIKRAGK